MVLEWRAMARELESLMTSLKGDLKFFFLELLQSFTKLILELGLGVYNF